MQLHVPWSPLACSCSPPCRCATPLLPAAGSLPCCPQLPPWLQWLLQTTYSWQQFKLEQEMARRLRPEWREMIEVTQQLAERVDKITEALEQQQEA